MSRQKNDGRGRLGGRTKGTPNKVSITLKEFIANIIDDNRAQIIQDLKSLDAKERLQMLERLMQYVIPKQQAQSLDMLKLTDEQINELCNELTKDI